MRLDDVRGFVFDADGTLVRRDRDHALHAIPGAREVLATIRASGRPFAVFTNGTHVHPHAWASELRAAGLAIDGEQVLTPVCSCIGYLHRRHRGQRVLLLAEGVARERMAAAGVPLVADRNGRDEPADVVFVAHVAGADFAVFERAARAVVGGARLLTASYQPAYAGADGPIFSRGAMATAAIAKASDTRPTVVGKPSRAAVRAVVERLGIPSDQLAVIGDDVRMDIGLGVAGGSRTVLVRTGISGQFDVARVPERRRPDAVVDTVADVLAWL